MSTPLNGSLLKGFEILGLFSRERPEIDAATVMAELEMNGATAHRFLATLEEAGAIASVRRGLYRLSHTTAELGRLAEETNPLARQVQPLLDQLSASLQESVMICRFSRRGPVCIAVATAQRAFALSFRIGEVLDLLRSAQGRLWLADLSRPDREKTVQAAGLPMDQLGPLQDELDRIRAAGLAENLGSVEADVGAVSVPVRQGAGGKGELVLTLSVFGPLRRFTGDLRSRAAPELRSTAVEIARRLQR